jgi:hypothetical protein
MSKKQAKNQVKTFNLYTIRAILNECSNHKELKSVHTTLTAIKLSKELDAILEKNDSVQKDLLISLGADKKQESGREFFDWNDKPEEVKEKISAALSELNNTEHSVALLNTIDEDEFVIFTSGLKHDKVLFLYDYLVKK